MIICAGKSENFTFAKPIGVGLIESAINLTKICIFEKPNLLIFVGSCGLYKKGNIFDIILSKTATNIEISSLENQSYTPLFQKISNNFHFENKQNLALNSKKKSINFLNVSYETINSSNYITTNQNLSFKLYDKGIFGENMEFFSVLQVADTFKIPAFGIFIATNFCNQNAHNDFLKNHKDAKEILTNYLKNEELI